MHVFRADGLAPDKQWMCFSLGRTASLPALLPCLWFFVWGRVRRLFPLCSVACALVSFRTNLLTKTTTVIP